MAFRSIANPIELARLQQVLDEYCNEFNIAPEQREREQAAFYIMELYASGVTTDEELRSRLKDSNI